MNRKENLDKLKSESYDICIVGAGASGSGVALDAALRGLKVAIIDRGDFCGETSSRSTKLIHGGVRYLEQAFKKLDIEPLKQVKHGLAERHYLLENAPHLTRPLGIITPVFSLFEAFYYSVGLRLYGWFAKGDNMPKSTWLSKKETLAFSPQINPKIHSSVMYYDGQLDDARYTLSMVQSANALGVSAVNYVSLVEFKKNEDGKLTEAKVKDEETGEEFYIKSKLFVNCTGPYADFVRLLANPTETPRIQPAKGVHIVIDKSFYNSDKAMLIPKTKDGRLVFVIPFKTEVMIGTTDTPYKNLEEEPVLEQSEADFLIETVTEFLVKIPEKKDIKAGFGGIRPLLSAKATTSNETKGLLRDHEVEIDASSGLVSLLGGKWTTYRLMAEDTVNKICNILGNDKESTTHHYKIWGAETLKETPFEPHFKTINAETLRHLHENYGNKVSEVLKIAKENDVFQEKIHANHPYLKAEIVYACRFEMVVKPRDFFARRLRLEILDWAALEVSIEPTCIIMAEELGWDENKLKAETASYVELIRSFKSKISK